MHTILVVLSGLCLLGFLLLAGNWSGIGTTGAALAFIPIWLTLSLINLWLGVSRAGYSFGEELPILAVVFAVPVGAAGLFWWFLR